MYRHNIVYSRLLFAFLAALRTYKSNRIPVGSAVRQPYSPISRKVAKPQRMQPFKTRHTCDKKLRHAFATEAGLVL